MMVSEVGMSDCTHPGPFPVQCDERTAGLIKGWRPVALAFFAFAATCAQAAPVDVYRGTLGGADVVMELGQPKAGGEREGRYFYVRNGVDIPLKGTLGALAEALPVNDEWRRAKMSFVISGIGHAMGACLGSGVDISFKKLKPYLKPGAERYFQP